MTKQNCVCNQPTMRFHRRETARHDPYSREAHPLIAPPADRCVEAHERHEFHIAFPNENDMWTGELNSKSQADFELKT